MKKALLLAAVGTLTLSACTLVGNPLKKDVTGQLKGFDKDQKLRLAIVGYNNGQYTADASESQLVDKYLTGGFALDLPTNVPYGSYRVVVFRDVNSNGRYDLGDQIVSKSNGKLLLYTNMRDAILKGTVKGWNLYDTNTGKLQINLLNNYDLEIQ